MPAVILDTDLGNDPDDIVAIVLLCRMLQKGDISDLAIITTDERPDIKPEPVPVLLADGTPRTHRELRHRAPIVRKIVDGLKIGNPVTVVKGLPSPNDVAFSKELEAWAAEIDYEALPSFKHIQTCISEWKTHEKEVVWIGVGGMTNLAEVMKGTDLPTRVVQMGHQIDFDQAAYTVAKEVKDRTIGFWGKQIETNIRMDPEACNEVITACKGKNVPLTFVMLDTTGYNLAWMKPNFDRAITDPVVRLSTGDGTIGQTLLPLLTAQLEPLRINCNFFRAPSYLHDPLTVVHAIYPDLDLFPLKKAALHVVVEGGVTPRPPVAPQPNGRTEIQLTSDEYPDKESTWWKVYGSQCVSTNCTISFGPQTEEQRGLFLGQLYKLLTPASAPAGGRRKIRRSAKKAKNTRNTRKTRN